VPCRIEANQCGWPSILPLIVQMDDQASRIGPDPAMTEGRQGTAKRPIVAVVDDDPAVCLAEIRARTGGICRAHLSQRRRVLHADDLKDCNCFVVDQRMPGMPGMELVEVLRERLVLTPAILIISHPNAALSARALNAAIPIVEKPLLGDALVERIREACWA
jgi:two-component system response regulator FixJ